MISIFGNLIDEILPKDESKGSLNLGNYLAAINKDLLKEKNIIVHLIKFWGSKFILLQAVLTVAKTNMIKYQDFDQIKYHQIIMAMDTPEYNMLEQFEQGIQFINNARKEGNVLVHCFQGISRSASMIIAYLMKEFNWNYDDALQYTMKKRYSVNPNSGFVLQLKQFGETQLEKIITTNQKNQNSE